MHYLISILEVLKLHADQGIKSPDLMWHALACSEEKEALKSMLVTNTHNPYSSSDESTELNGLHDYDSLRQ